MLSIQTIISKKFINVTNVKNKDQISCQHNQVDPWKSFLGKSKSRPETMEDTCLECLKRVEIMLNYKSYTWFLGKNIT